MDAVDLVSLGLSAVGVAVSIWAIVQAGGAKRAVSRALDKNSDQGARDIARELLAKLTSAKEAALARRQGAPTSSTGGRLVAADIEALQRAQDALATSTLGVGEALGIDLQRAANQLNNNLGRLAGGSTRDEWADALLVLQGVIPKIDLLHRELSANLLR